MDVCLATNGKLTIRDRQKFFVFPFNVPPGTTALKIEFHYQPGAVEKIHNLLTLTLIDPQGFRGAAHRWQVDQTVQISAGAATPGFFAGVLPAGEWQIEIDAHEICNDGDKTGWCEYSLTISTESGSTLAEIAPSCRGELPPAVIHQKPGWYRGDLHSHSLHCDGANTIEEMAAAARQAGLDFLAFTGHNTTAWMETENRFPPGFLPIRGMECTTYFGHANALGVNRWIDWRTQDRVFGLSAIADRVHQVDGALFILNHPCAVGNPFCTGCHLDFGGVDFRKVDGIEIWNGTWQCRGGYNEANLEFWNSLLNQGYRLAAVSGVDAHNARVYSEPGNPWNCVFASGLSEAGVLEAIRMGRVIISCGPNLSVRVAAENGFSTNLPGTQIPPCPVDLQVEVEGGSEPSSLWLVCDGQPVARKDIRTQPAKIEFNQVKPEKWCRLEVRVGDAPRGDLLAITNPFYW
ncbi:MAG TPA: CehA/McbA family metallohydrolase [Anaerolineaceae bacterium]